MRALVLGSLLLLSTQGLAQDSFSDLLRRVPEQANVVVLIDRDALLASPLSVREGWAKTSEANYMAGASAIPPGADKLLYAAQLIPGTLGNTWEIGLAVMKTKVSMDEVARKEKHAVDTLAGFPVVLCPRDAYFVQIDPQVIGTLHPGNRQQLARWLQFVKRNKHPVVSAYLQDTLRNVSDKSQIALAVDTLDMADVKDIRRVLTLSRVLADKKPDLDATAKVLAGLQGIRVTLAVDDRIHGEMHLDFSDSVAPIVPFIKPLLLEALGFVGAALDELADWKVVPGETSVVLQGTLSTRTLRQFLSVVHTPPPTQAHASEMVPPPEPSNDNGDPKAAASQRYFKSIQTVLNDLADIKSKSFNGIAYWYEKYAKDVDQLPILNVDPELLNYGNGVSVMLRSIAASLRGTRMNKELLDQYKGEATFSTPSYYNYWSGPGYWYAYGNPGSYYEINNYNAIIRLQSQAASADDVSRKMAWNLVLEKSNLVRQRMVAKYNVEFGAAMKTGSTSELKTTDKPPKK
jgi:hypothetical protein